MFNGAVLLSDAHEHNMTSLLHAIPSPCLLALHRSEAQQCCRVRYTQDHHASVYAHTPRQVVVDERQQTGQLESMQWDASTKNIHGSKN